MAYADFRHRLPLRVRWAEVDKQDIVFINNLQVRPKATPANPPAANPYTSYFILRTTADPGTPPAPIVGAEPENFDKEYLRQWFAERGYRGDGEPPRMPDDFVARVALIDQNNKAAEFKTPNGQPFQKPLTVCPP